jgi:hypothetical protein
MWREEKALGMSVYFNQYPYLIFRCLYEANDRQILS